jgi:large subunit ribosomal protein L15
LDTLKQANVIRGDKKFVKLILSGEVSQAYTVKGIKIGVTKGARAAIEAAGGKIED